MCHFSAGVRFLGVPGGESYIIGGDGLAIGKISPPTGQFIRAFGGQPVGGVGGLRHRATLDALAPTHLTFPVTG